MGGRMTLHLGVPCAVALDFPEICRERVLLLPAQYLVRKHQNVMTAERLADLLELIWRQPTRHVEAGDHDPAGLRQWWAEDATHFPPDSKFVSQSEPEQPK